MYLTLPQHLKPSSLKKIFKFRAIVKKNIAVSLDNVIEQKAKILTGIIINIYLPWNGKDIILKVKMKVINSVYELVIIAILMNMKNPRHSFPQKMP